MDWKRIGKQLLFPPGWLIALLSVCSALALACVFLKGWDKSPLAGVVYGIAFYALVVGCIFVAAVLPRRYRAVKGKIGRTPLGHRYLTDAVFKARVWLYPALMINLGYSAFNLVSGVRYSSPWLGGVAVYYILLSVIRFLLLRSMGREQRVIRQYKRYRLTAVLMLLVNLTLSGMIFQMILCQQPSVYSDAYVIASAAYTFYTLTVSIVDVVRYRWYQNPLLSATKVIRLTAALVSMLSLEATMIVQFGDDTVFRRLMLIWTGAGVCTAIVSMSVYMIVRSTRAIKRLQGDYIS